jgi:hypothetical protein
MYLRSVPLLLLPACLTAQTAQPADTTPFHRGQWAAQFLGLTSSIGVLKFRSPTSAWVLDLDIFGGHGETLVGDTLTSLSSQASVVVRIGRRTFKPLSRSVVGHRSIGVALGFNHFVGRGGAGSNGFSVGPQVDLGATYLVVSHIGVGAYGRVGIGYSRSWFNTGFSKAHSWQLTGGTDIEFLTTIYF